MKIVIAGIFTVLFIAGITAIGALSKIQGKEDLAWELLSACIAAGEAEGTCTLSYTSGDGQPISISVNNELIFKMKN